MYIIVGVKWDWRKYLKSIGTSRIVPFLSLMESQNARLYGFMGCATLLKVSFLILLIPYLQFMKEFELN